MFPVAVKILTAKLFVAGQAEGLPTKRAKGCPATAWTFKERKKAGLFTAIFVSTWQTFYKHKFQLPLYFASVAHMFRCPLYCEKTHNQLDCEALHVKTLSMF